MSGRMWTVEGVLTALDRILLRLAVALRPKAQRQRWREQWQADVQGAAELGLSPHRVAGAAVVAAILAPRRRARGYDPAASAVRTTKIVVAVAAAVLVAFFSLPFGLIVAPTGLVVSVVVASFRAGARLRAWITGAAGAVWLVASAVAWWLWGLAFDLADNNQPTTSIDSYLRPALVTAMVAFAAIVGLGIAEVIGSSRRRDGQRR